jgi:hypothetical protein
MLHKHVQVLNHYPSINSDSKTDFLKTYSGQKVNYFMDKVLDISAREESIKGEGGVITTSHAFREHKIMKDTYYKRYKTAAKGMVRSIVWKDSHRNTNIIMANNSLDLLLSEDERFRFMLPIRNPMDCAKSNFPGWKSLFVGGADSKEDVLRIILEMYGWFFNHESNHKHRMMYFFEDESDKFISNFEQFCKVEEDENWPKDVKKVWKIKPSYNHDAKFIKLYNDLVEKNIPGKDLRNKFYKFSK